MSNTAAIFIAAAFLVALGMWIEHMTGFVAKIMKRHG